eukprot:6127516-Karenia_brevis.AAC.1
MPNWRSCMSTLTCRGARCSSFPPYRCILFMLASCVQHSYVSPYRYPTLTTSSRVDGSGPSSKGQQRGNLCCSL